MWVNTGFVSYYYDPIVYVSFCKTLIGIFLSISRDRIGDRIWWYLCISEEFFLSLLMVFGRYALKLVVRSSFVFLLQSHKIRSTWRCLIRVKTGWTIASVEISRDIIRGREWEFTEPSSIQSSILQVEDYRFWWVKPLKRSIKGFWFLETISGGLKSITIPVLLTG
ncbi:hypothetical protein Hanom_Chr17g01533551 [Helianthus anomalus]